MTLTKLTKEQMELEILEGDPPVPSFNALEEILSQYQMNTKKSDSDLRIDPLYSGNVYINIVASENSNGSSSDAQASDSSVGTSRNPLDSSWKKLVFLSEHALLLGDEDGFQFSIPCSHIESLIRVKEENSPSKHALELQLSNICRIRIRTQDPVNQEELGRAFHQIVKSSGAHNDLRENHVQSNENIIGLKDIQGIEIVEQPLAVQKNNTLGIEDTTTFNTTIFQPPNAKKDSQKKSKHPPPISPPEAYSDYGVRSESRDFELSPDSSRSITRSTPRSTSSDVSQRQQSMRNWYLQKTKKKELLSLRNSVESVMDAEEELWWKKYTSEINPDPEINDGLTSVQITNHMHSFKSFALQFDALNQLDDDLPEINVFESFNGMSFPESFGSLRSPPESSRFSPITLLSELNESILNEKDTFVGLDRSLRSDVYDSLDMSAMGEKSPETHHTHKMNLDKISTPKQDLRRMFHSNLSDVKNMHRFSQGENSYLDSWRSFGLESPQTPNTFNESRGEKWDIDSPPTKKCCTIL